MSRLTKVSKHRQGMVKFGTRPQADDWDPTVKTWTMTPEELEAYKSKGEVQMSDIKTKSIEEYNSLLKQFEERGDLVEELQGVVDKYKDELIMVGDLLTEWKMKHSEAEREQEIAEENLKLANKNLRYKEAEVETCISELSYARENERTLRENEQIFRTALKAAL